MSSCIQRVQGDILSPDSTAPCGPIYGRFVVPWNRPHLTDRGYTRLIKLGWFDIEEEEEEEGVKDIHDKSQAQTEKAVVFGGLHTAKN